MAVSRICGKLKSFHLLKSMPIITKSKYLTRKYPPPRLLSRLLIRFVASTLSLSHSHSQICYFRLMQMNCLHSLSRYALNFHVMLSSICHFKICKSHTYLFSISRSSALPIQTFKSYASKPPCSVSTVVVYTPALT